MKKRWCILLAACLLAMSACGRADGQAQGGAAVQETQNAQEQSGAQAGGLQSDETVFDYHIEERWIENGEEPIYGKAYVPHGDGPFACVLWSHGIGATHASANDYARELARHGYLAYTFDYPGGSTAPNKSGGDGLQMSVLTEMENLKTVRAAAAAWEDVDASRIVLLGESQGGLVSALVAAEDPSAVPALMLLYPAFSIMADAHSLFASEEDIPETIDLFNGYMTLGRRYYTDIWDRDAYSEIGAYEGPVLIVHGTADGVVPISYSQRAADIYKDAEYHAIAGGEHGFSGAHKREATAYILAFLAEHLDR